MLRLGDGERDERRTSAAAGLVLRVDRHADEQRGQEREDVGLQERDEQLEQADHGARRATEATPTPTLSAADAVGEHAR